MLQGECRDCSFQIYVAKLGLQMYCMGYKVSRDKCFVLFFSSAFCDKYTCKYLCIYLNIELQITVHQLKSWWFVTSAIPLSSIHQCIYSLVTCSKSIAQGQGRFMLPEGYLIGLLDLISSTVQTRKS